MADVIEIFRGMPDFIGSTGRSEEEILHAERALGISFAKDYREYLEKIGLACFDGHELTGLTNTMRLDVVSVTNEKREQFGDCVSSWYVVEDTNIFGIVIWQDSDGVVYETAPNTKTKIIAKSLLEYITK